ncbi:MAG: YcxB family protein [Lewinellaceae bacterium]|nr:YcxB family protein [Lewinellaceae bacterium]
MSPIELSFQYTEADYQEFLRHYFWKNRSRLYLALGVLALVALVITQRGDTASLSFWISTLVPVTLILVLWWAVLRFSGRRAFQMTPEMSEQRNCVIDSDNITVRGQTFLSEFKWAGVLYLVETKNLVLVYNSKTNAVMLPKRAFSTDQFAAFKHLVDSNPALASKWKS